MHWVTGSGIKINRAATAWLIRRFIDPEARFVFVAIDDNRQPRRVPPLEG